MLLTRMWSGQCRPTTASVVKMSYDSIYECAAERTLVVVLLEKAILSKEGGALPSVSHYRPPRTLVLVDALSELGGRRLVFYI